MRKIVRNAFFYSVSLDPDAKNGIVAGGITDPVVIAAINNYILSMKLNQFWNRHDKIMLIAGGTNQSTAIDFKNPNTPASWNGTFTINSGGFTGNGSNGYGNLNWNPATQGVNYIQDSAGVDLYITTNVNESKEDIGCNDGTNYITMRSRGSDFIYNNLNTSNLNFLTANTDSRGLISIDRSSSTVVKNYRNGVQVGSNGSKASTTIPSRNIYLGCSNGNGTATNFATKTYAYVGFRNSFNATEMATLYSIIQTFQTSLSRNV